MEDNEITKEKYDKHGKMMYLAGLFAGIGMMGIMFAIYLSLNS